MKNAIILAVVILSIGILKAQSPEKPGLTSRPVSRDVIYRTLFKEIAAYQREADRLTQQGKPDAFVRNYHRQVLELSPQHFAKVRTVALDCVARVREVDNQARQIIEAVKSKHKNIPRGAPNALVPPPPSQLLILEEQRKSIVLAAADSLKAEIGPAQFAYFENMARRHVGSGYAPASKIVGEGQR